jgi:hypothetical protein
LTVDGIVKSLELSFESKAAEIIACVQNSTYEPGLFTIPSTEYRPELSLVFYPFRARYFGIIGSRSIFFPLVAGSPIRFKAIVL